MSHSDWDHSWLKKLSVVAYKDESGGYKRKYGKDKKTVVDIERVYSTKEKLLRNWALEYKSKSKNSEYAMALFTKTLIDANGQEIQVVIPGSTAHGEPNDDPLKMHSKKIPMNQK